MFFSLKFFKFIYSRLIQPKNMKQMMVTKEDSKFDKSKEVNDEQL